MTVPRIITSASAYSKGILLVAAMDRRRRDIDPFDPSSKLIYFVEHRPEPWSESEASASIVSLTRYRYPDRDRQIQAALTAEGHVGFYGREEGFYEKIKGAGLHAEDAIGQGYMTAIRQIGAHLYACGAGGQIYRRTAANEWAHLDEGMLSLGRDVIIDAVDGVDEESVYLAGQNGAAYWKGKGPVQDLALPTSAWLTCIHAQDDRDIWICGSGGVLLRGNHVDGFREAAASVGKETLLSMAHFQGRYYVATARHLFVLEGSRLRQVSTSLVPELADAHLLDAVDGVLWSVGYRDVARFDGQRWERFDLPGNPPIR